MTRFVTRQTRTAVSASVGVVSLGAGALGTVMRGPLGLLRQAVGAFPAERMHLMHSLQLRL